MTRRRRWDRLRRGALVMRDGSRAAGDGALDVRRGARATRRRKPYPTEPEPAESASGRRDALLVVASFPPSPFSLSLSLPFPLPGSGLALAVGCACLRGSDARGRCGRSRLAGPLRRPTRLRAACEQVRAGKGEEHGRGQRDPRGQDAETRRRARSRSVVADRRAADRSDRTAARRRLERRRSGHGRRGLATAASRQCRDRDHRGHRVRIDRGAIGGQRVTQRHGVGVPVGRIGGHRLGDDRGQVGRDAVERRGRRLAGGKRAGRVRRRHRRHTR